MDIFDKYNSRKFILVINGPNLNMLGRRDTALYGSHTLDEINTGLKERFTARIKPEFFQSNHEGALIDMIQAAAGRPDCIGIVINPGAYAHTSLAMADALADFAGSGLPYVEVHISDIFDREPIRRRSLTSAKALKMISGHGAEGYAEAIELILSNPNRQTFRP